MTIDNEDDKRAYFQAIGNPNLSLRDLDIDAFANGIIAHRFGVLFHENPHGDAGRASLRRLSWSMGWNERALQSPGPLSWSPNATAPETDSGKPP